MHISGRELGVDGSPNSVAGNGGCIGTDEATTGLVTWLMVIRNAAGIIVGMLASLDKLDPPEVELRETASILWPFNFVERR